MQLFVWEQDEAGVGSVRSELVEGRCVTRSFDRLRTNGVACLRHPELDYLRRPLAQDLMGLHVVGFEIVTPVTLI